ncbi:DNA polymerase III subunit alpha [Porphyridium purpureum]|uniref:DNA-directed DNA polymerase n=1 Tax=Porphyridium purpureum TaxID=35688 RepID=A0A5J4ZAC9_PORPP|nr:DNA polymerase III subunit alpha [Porphyridium purpureum]|eukprot:POR9475..scf295_1
MDAALLQPARASSTRGAFVPGPVPARYSRLAVRGHQRRFVTQRGRAFRHRPMQCLLSGKGNLQHQRMHTRAGLLARKSAGGNLGDRTETVSREDERSRDDLEQPNDEQVVEEALAKLKAGELRDYDEEELWSDLEAYVPLHVHTDFSFLDGASQIPRLVAKAKSMNTPALAITDHGVLHGAIELIKECNRAGIKPIVGNEMYVLNGDISLKNNPKERRFHLVVLAKNTIGYKNLVKLTTISHIEGFYYKPRISKDLLVKYKEGLIISSACLGSEISQTLLKVPDHPEMFGVALQIALWYQDHFGEDFFLEIQDHGYPEDRVVNPMILDIGRILGIKVVATNDSHYTEGDECVPHDTLLCVQTGRKLKEPNRMHYSGTEFFKSPDEMRHLFVDHIHPTDVKRALLNTLEVAKKVEAYDIFGEPRIPPFPVPDGISQHDFLERAAKDGMRSRFIRKRQVKAGMSKASPSAPEARIEAPKVENDIPIEYLERLDFELEMISSMGFSSYFLVVWDYIRHAREELAIPVGPGRGSAAGSLVAYALEITDIDPVENGLLFERFLNPERKSMPDIDSDFSVEGREKVIRYVSQKYGKDHVAQIATFNRLTSKAVLKDVARVLGIPLAVADKTTKMIPVIRGKPAKLDELISEKNSPSVEFRNKYVKEERIEGCEEFSFKEWVDIARALEGTNKTSGVHAAGVVISSEPLDELVPLTLGKQQEIITQYNMEDVESLGLLKMDFLGLKNLSVVEKAVNFVRVRNKELGFAGDLDMRPENLKLDDRRTYDFLAEGELDGIFQLDASSGMRQIVRELKPSSLGDISSILALYRPGPLDAGLIPEFIARKHGKAEITYEFAELEPILKETYGVLVYQEQIMRVAREIGGYTLGQADILRRAMGKKKAEEMQRESSRFIEGAVKKGFSRAKVTKYFDVMSNFAEYCFNKSHSKAYALITFQTAYLKANYPVEFSAALLEANSTVIDKLPRYLNDAHLLGVSVLPPSINESGLGFKPVYRATDYDSHGQLIPGRGRLRFGLDAIKGVRGAATVLTAERHASGPFRSIIDLIQRIDDRGVSKRSLEPMVLCGAFDALHPNRKVLVELIPDILACVKKYRKKPLPPKKRKSKKSPAMSAEEEEIAYERAVADYQEQKNNELFELDQKLSAQNSGPDFSQEEKVGFERNLVGFYISGHPTLTPSAASLSRFLRPTGLASVSGSVVAQFVPDDVDPVESQDDPTESLDNPDVEDTDKDHGLVANSSAERRGIFRASRPARLVQSGAEILCFAVIASLKELTTKKGTKMAKVGLEGFDGSSCDAVLFPMTYKNMKNVLGEGKLFALWGEVDRSSQFTQIKVEDGVELNQMVFLRVMTSTDRNRESELKAFLDSYILEWKNSKRSGYTRRVPVALDLLPNFSGNEPSNDGRLNYYTLPSEIALWEAAVAEHKNNPFRDGLPGMNVIGVKGMKKKLMEFRFNIPLERLADVAEKLRERGFLADVFNWSQLEGGGMG